MYNILICDDEKDIVSALKIYLSSPNLNIFEAYSGEEALSVLEENEVQLILMDIMMPRLDGISAMIKVREKSNIPIILLTAKSEDADKVAGLNLGADDYITKPFNPGEVIARVNSQLRRYMQLGGTRTSVKEDEGIIRIFGIELNDGEKTVTVDGEGISVTPTEYEILKLLMKAPGRVFSPAEIYRSVWGENPHGVENTVAVHIRHLREKIEINPAEPRFLKVIWGHGYKIEREER